MNAPERITLAFTGASGMPYGLRLLECLIEAKKTVWVLVSQAAHVVIGSECDFTLPPQPRAAQALLAERYRAADGQLIVFGREDWMAPVASGSNPADAMVICPCSMGTLAAVAQGLADNLIERAADVMLKERRPLLLVPRETPLSTIHLENMLRLSRAGAVIIPPAPGFYTRPETIDDMVDFVVARILDQLHVPNALTARWGRVADAPDGHEVLTGLFTGAGRSTVVRLPIFPLKTVLFPGGRLPIRVFETRYMEMVKECLKDGQAFGICAITAGEEVGRPATYAPIGTIAKIESWDMPQLGILNLVTEGGSRFNVLERNVSPAGLAHAEVSLLQEEDAGSAPEPTPALVELLEKLIERVGADHFSAARHFDDPNWVSYRLAEILPIKLSVKQKLLEVNDSEVRLRVIAEFLKLQGVMPR